MTSRMNACLLGLLLILAGRAWAQSPPAAQTPPVPPPAVEVGEQAPDFTLPYLVAKPDGGFESKQVSLSHYRGKQNVVLAFFPAAFSPG